MKFFVSAIFSFSCYFVTAQANDWLKGTWHGVRTFPGGRTTIGVPVRFEVDSVTKNKFSARFIYMFPSDTSARLIIQIKGGITGREVKILNSKEVYLEHRRLRSFWSDCSGCVQKITYTMDDIKLSMTINYSNCGDSCNGETVFSRRLSEFDEPALARVTKLFSEKKLTELPGSKAKVKVRNAKAGKTITRSEVSTPQTVKVKPLNKKILNMDTAKTTALIKHQDSVSTPKQTPASSDKSARKNTTIATGNSTQKSVEHRAADDSANVHSIAIANTVKDTIPAAITQRDTKLVTTYQVSSPHINVQLFDNGEIDYDAVSVYYNGRLIVNNLTLTHKAISFTIDASAANRHHEFILIAETEGMIAPNTALMRISAGSQQYELEVSSSTKRNAKIAIDYTGK